MCTGRAGCEHSMMAELLQTGRDVDSASSTALRYVSIYSGGTARRAFITPPECGP
jgi:hypothetical protein